MNVGQRWFSVQMAQNLAARVMHYTAEHGVFPEKISVELPYEKPITDLDTRKKFRRMTFNVYMMPVNDDLKTTLTLLGAQEKPKMTWQQKALPALIHAVYFECVNDEVLPELGLVQ